MRYVRSCYQEVHQRSKAIHRTQSKRAVQKRQGHSATAYVPKPCVPYLSPVVSLQSIGRETRFHSLQKRVSTGIVFVTFFSVMNICRGVVHLLRCRKSSQIPLSGRSRMVRSKAVTYGSSRPKKELSAYCRRLLHKYFISVKLVL